ncbi:MAG: ABC transporter ATP-binding protein [Deltaproteobacteria bacterium]|nr:ABC transporter ATP-binding protein [Deltaproteobacteria bacterium]
MSLRLVRSNGKPAISEDSLLPRTTIALKNLRVSYDSNFALGCNETICGNVIAVLGHNGAGKSTLLKSILGLIPLKAGSIDMSLRRGELVHELLPEKHIAYCPESGAVFADITVEHYIKLWCRIRHRNSHYYLKEGSRYIELLNLEHLLGKLGRELSKGQRRRVQTAIGFFMKPDLFLLDEPFDGLDVQKSHELAEIIEEHSGRMSFILSSHRMDVIERLADTFVVLDQGRVFANSSLDQVCSRLAGQSVSLSFNREIESVTKLLKEHFSSLLVTHIASHVTLTGEGINLAAIKEFLTARNLHPLSIEQSRPSLVDAMNYHLRKVSLKQS